MPALSVLGHQGGWDEILLVVTPIALFAGLLWLANRRAAGRLSESGGGDRDRAGVTTPTEAAQTDEPRRW